MKSISASQTGSTERLPTLSNLTYRLLIGPQRFWLVFRDADHNFPGKLFLKKGFSHVIVVQQHDFGWVFLNPTRAHLHCDIMDFGVNENPLELLKQDMPDITILEVVVTIDSDVDNFFNPINCVVMANYLLGLRWPPFSCITPYALYCNLLKGEHPNLIKVKELHYDRQSINSNEKSNERSQSSDFSNATTKCIAHREKQQIARESPA